MNETNSSKSTGGVVVHAPLDETAAAVALLTRLGRRVAAVVLDDARVHGLPAELRELAITSAAWRRDVARFDNVVVARDPRERARLADAVAAAGGAFAAGLARGPGIAPSVVVGHGTLVAPQCSIVSRTTLGAFVVVEATTSIGHDCAIGDFATILAGTAVSGYVVIGSGAVLGPRATVVNGSKHRPLRIGAGAIVDPGAVVTKDVPAQTRVGGNPAR